MTQNMKIFSAFLVAILIVGTPAPSFGFGMLKGGGGGSSAVAEILAAGLITGMLMDNRPRSSPMMQALRHPLIGGYTFMSPRHAMHPMMTARVPMMSHYVLPMMHRPRYMMRHAALMTQASRHQALASRLNEEIRALEAQESILEAYLARHQQGGAEPAFNQLLNEEDTIPAAALLLGTADLMGPEENIENPLPPHPHSLPPPEMFQTAASEPESRYILPRIVRHFVQRLMRRGEHH